MMDQLIEKFITQLQESIQIGEDAVLALPEQEILHVYIAGMGGSGIGGNFVAEFTAKELSVPCMVGKSYDIPHYIGANTLAIVSSYSGNTEETLSAFRQIREKSAKIVVVSSGGKLIDLAKKHNIDYILLPSGWPSPRACLGYSVVAQLFVLHKLGLIGRSLINDVENSISFLKEKKDAIKAEAKKIAPLLNGKIPIIYTTNGMESVATRWRQQINENSKMLAWHQIIPEMNHNELVGWTNHRKEWAVLWLRNTSDFHKNAIRMDICKEIISQYSDTTIEIWSEGDSKIERALYFVHLGDWLSYYLSQEHGVDAMQVDAIDLLKSKLAEISDA